MRFKVTIFIAFASVAYVTASINSKLIHGIFEMGTFRKLSLLHCDDDGKELYYHV